MTNATTQKRERCDLRKAGRIAATWMIACILSFMGMPSAAFAAARDGATDLTACATVSIPGQPVIAQKGTWGSSAWTLCNDGVLELESGAGVDTMGTSPWAKIADQVEAIKIVGTVEMPEDVSYLFAGMSELAAIEGMDRLDWSSGTMRTDFMFERCASLAEINLSNINIAEALHRDKVVDSEKGETVVAVEGSRQNSSSQGMFDGCTSLEKLVMGAGWREVRNAPEIVGNYDDGTLTPAAFPVTMADETGTVHHKNTGVPYGAQTYTRHVPDYERGAVASGTWGTCDWFITPDGILRIDEGTAAAQEADASSPWADYADIIKRIRFVGVVRLDVGRADGGRASADFNHLFASLTSLESVNGKEDGLGNVVTTTFWGSTGAQWSTVRSIAGMFEGCTALRAVDLTGLPLPGCFNLSGMFAGCTALEKADLSALETARSSYDDDGYTSVPGMPLRDMRGMFAGCTALQELIVGKNWGQPTSGFDEFTGEFADWCATFPVAMRNGNEALREAGERIPDGFARYEAALAQKNSHTISVMPAENGTLTATEAYAEPGDKIVVKALPDEGYELESVTILDAAGKTVNVDEIELVWAAVDLPYPYGYERHFSFVMPDSNVTASAAFAPTGGAPDPKPEYHSVQIVQSEGGTVTASANSAIADEMITVNVVPDWGYDSGDVTVRDASGARVPSEEIWRCAYHMEPYAPYPEDYVRILRFKMPDSDVFIDVQFSEARWKPALVKFDANGGEGFMESWLTDAREARTLPAGEFEREGHTFTGWNTTPDGSGNSYADRAEIAPDRPEMTLYAQWEPAGMKPDPEPEFHAVKVAQSEGGAVKVSGEFATEGDQIMVWVLPDENHEPEWVSVASGETMIELSRWRPDPDDAARTFEFSFPMPNYDVTVTAAFHAIEEKNVIVIFDANDGAGTGTDTSAVTNKTLEVKIDTPLELTDFGMTRKGYDLVGWRDETGVIHELGSEIIVENDMTLKAVWTESTSPTTKTCILAFEAGFENLLPWMSKVGVPSGSTFTISSMDLSRDGYELAGWRDEAGGIHALGSIITVNRDMQFTAVWNRVPEAPEDDPADEHKEQLSDSEQQDQQRKQALEQEKEQMLENLASDFESKHISYAQLLLRSTKQTDASVKLQWKKCSDASKYVVFGSKSSDGDFAMLTMTKKASFNAVEIDGSPLRSGTAYKFTVIALDKTGDIVALSKSINVITTGGKYTNAKGVKVAAKSGKMKLAKGEKFKLKGRIVKANSKLSLMRKSTVSYESSNPRIASVSSHGVIKAKKAGACYVYAYAEGGAYKRVKVAVK